MKIIWWSRLNLMWLVVVDLLMSKKCLSWSSKIIFFLRKMVYVFQFHEQSFQRKMVVEINVLWKKKFSQDYSKTRNNEKFLHKSYQKNLLFIATLFLKLFKAIDIFSRYILIYRLCLLFSFSIKNG